MPMVARQLRGHRQERFTVKHGPSVPNWLPQVHRPSPPRLAPCDARRPSQPIRDGISAVWYADCYKRRAKQGRTPNSRRPTQYGSEGGGGGSGGGGGGGDSGGRRSGRGAAGGGDGGGSCGGSCGGGSRGGVGIFFVLLLPPERLLPAERRLGRPCRTPGCMLRSLRKLRRGWHSILCLRCLREGK